MSVLHFKKKKIFCFIPTAKKDIFAVNIWDLL